MENSTSIVLLQLAMRMIHSDSNWYFLMASSRGVRPFLSRFEVSAQQSNSKYSTTSFSPRKAAKCNGVYGVV